MTDKEAQAYEVPLHEQLASVPRNARLVIDDGIETRFIPVGRMCHEAAEAIRARLAQCDAGEICLGCRVCPDAQPEPEPPLAQRNGDCLLTSVCAAEGHQIAKENSDQKPVVWMYQDKSTNEVSFQKEMRSFIDHGATYEVPLYAAPPRREWQGLTDEEIIAMRHMRDWTAGWTDIRYAREVEAKLKEKNT